MSLIEIFWPAFVLALLLVFIHSIFGLEIIKRGVIFTDLATGQFAAVGIAISLLLFDGKYTFFLTLSFALLGAFLISIASYRVKHIEAFIGMLYALGASGVIIILSNSPEGVEIFSKLQASDILFISAQDLIQPSILYASVAIIFWKFYKKTSGFLKELLFFGLLALVVTSSVKLAGVLVVFVLLIVPALLSLLQSKFSQMPFAWFIGSAIVVLSMLISYNYDLPTGYTMVFISSLIGVISALSF
jgi:zinc/manganese transport system permease protein